MARWAIVADDLTGALDTALQFRKAGLRTLVSARDGSWPPAATVVAMSTASRHIEGAEAAAAVARAVGGAQADESTRIYKKTDSLLRGNVGPELQAALEATGATAMVYTPAFPSGGRTTESGTLALWGTPVAEAAPGRDLVTPALESHIPTLIASTSNLTCRVIDRQVVESGMGAIAAVFGEARRGDVRVILPDITEDSDLDAVAAAMAAADLMHVSGGSAGLAAALARVDESAREPTLELHATSNVVAIIGTPMEHTQQQVADVMDVLAIERIALRSGADELGPVVSAVHAAWAAGRVALVDAVIASAAPTPREQANQEARVAQFTAELLRVSPAFGLVVSGGDTARAAFGGIRAEAIELVGEIGWGVPYGVFSSGPAAGYPLVTKAGVMGGPSALADAFRAIGPLGSGVRS